MNSISNKNQHIMSYNLDYLRMRPQWIKIDDCIAGEDYIKSKTDVYLKKTMGMTEDIAMGQEYYNQYKDRAIFYNYPKELLDGLYGLLFQKMPTFDFEDEVDKWFVPYAYNLGSGSLYELYRSVANKIVRYGRHGVLLEPYTIEDGVYYEFPSTVEYDTYSIVDWEYSTIHGYNSLNRVVLDESYYNHTTREHVESYRVLALAYHPDFGKKVYYTYNINSNSDINSTQDINVNWNDPKYTVPTIRGIPFYNKIPFYGFGVTQKGLNPEPSPLQSSVDISLNIYRNEAVYRTVQHMQGASILFAKGVSSTELPTYVGGIMAMSTTSDTSDIKYVSANPMSLSELRVSLERLHEQANRLGFTPNKTSGDDSGESIKRAAGLRTSLLKTISKSLSETMTELVRDAIKWSDCNFIGRLNKDGTPLTKTTIINDTRIQPSLEFTTSSGNTADLLNVSKAWLDNCISDYEFYTWKLNNYFYTGTFDEFRNDVLDLRKKMEEASEKDAKVNTNSLNKKLNKLDVKKQVIDNNRDATPQI